ncbi:hypothetical protein [Galbibacter sp.]|uniref:hypothetical protein n=1 Tax=Galbibacter sp. TaxID=2918471 RepID=UPI003A8F4455
MGGISKNERSEIQVRQNTLELYTISIKLKETYNECQYYMSFKDLKTFYETSFFTKSKFCDQLHDHIKANNPLDLFLPKVKSIYYITFITFCLIFKSKEIEYLLNKALQLEEKSAEILKRINKLDQGKGGASIEEFIKSHSEQQPAHLNALRKMINTYY